MKIFQKILYILFFSLIFFAVRAPEYDIPLSGEDGIFADIFVNSPERPNYGQNARIHGKTIYASLGHPAPLYEFLAYSGKVFNYFLPLKKSLKDTPSVIATYLRFSFSSFQFISWLFLMYYLFTSSNKKTRWMDLSLLLLFAISPPAVIYSLWIQIDNANGSIITAILMASILLWDRYNTTSLKKRFALMFFAGFISALGKNEWSILFFLSIMATLIFLIYRKKKEKENEKEISSKDDVSILTSMLTGLIVGNIFSYLINPDTYLGGFELMTSMSQKSSLMNTSQLSKWWTLTMIRMPILYLAMALWLYVSSVFIRKSYWKISTPIVLSFFISSALLWSFFITSWDPTERYFIPAFIALVYTLFLIKSTYKLFLDQFSYILILFLTLDTLNNYVTSLNIHQTRLQNYPEYLKSLPTKKGCIHHIQYYAFNYLDIDYVGVGNGPGNLEGHMKASGLKVCESP
jgi:hypothetical protein